MRSQLVIFLLTLYVSLAFASPFKLPGKKPSKNPGTKAPPVTHATTPPVTHATTPATTQAPTTPTTAPTTPATTHTTPTTTPTPTTHTTPTSSPTTHITPTTSPTTHSETTSHGTSTHSSTTGHTSSSSTTDGVTKYTHNPEAAVLSSPWSIKDRSIAPPTSNEIHSFAPAGIVAGLFAIPVIAAGSAFSGDFNKLIPAGDNSTASTATSTTGTALPTGTGGALPSSSATGASNSTNGGYSPGDYNFLVRRTRGTPKPKKEPAPLKVPCPTSWEHVVPYLTTPAKDHAMFYAGVGKPSTVSAYARKQSPKLQIIQDKLTADMKSTLNDKRCPQGWEHASAAYAHKASGDVYSWLPDLASGDETDASKWYVWPRKQLRAGQTVGDESVWSKIEWPTLKANSLVCKIWRLDSNGIEHAKLIAVRHGGVCPEAPEDGKTPSPNTVTMAKRVAEATPMPYVF